MTYKLIRLKEQLRNTNKEVKSIKHANDFDYL